MSRTRWRKDVTPDGVVTHTDPTGRVVIEKHTHHYGPWLVKDTDLDERVGETEVSEAEAKRLAEDYLAGPRSVPPPPPLATVARSAPSSSAEEAGPAAAAYATAVRLLSAQLRLLADEVQVSAEPRGPGSFGASASAVVAAWTRTAAGSPLAQLAALASAADLEAARTGAARRR